MKRVLALSFVICFFILSLGSYATFDAADGGIGGIEYTIEGEHYKLTLSGEGSVSSYNIPYNDVNGILNAFFEHVIITNSISEIESGTFYNWMRLRSVMVGQTVDLINSGAICACPELRVVFITNPNCVIKKDAISAANGITLNICGYKDSTAQAYAKASGLGFIEIICKCPNCKDYITENYNYKDQAVPATCTDTGLTEGSHCPFCGYVFEEQSVIPALKHKYEIVNETPATYFHTGLTSGICCTRCGDWLMEQGIIPKLVGEGIFGDVDGDRSVTIVDATYIQRKLANIMIPFNFNDPISDTDEDGTVTVIDATFIQRWLANLSSNDNIGREIS